MGAVMAKADPLATLQKSVQAAAKKLKTPNLADFAEILFSGAILEDIEALPAEALAGLAADSFAKLQKRTPGKPKIGIANPPPPFDTVTVIDIVNDDMPFLVDSTLAFLNEQGAEIRLLLHPIVQVKRESDGTLVSIHSRQDTGLGLARESIMRIHVARTEGEEQHQKLREGLFSTLSDVKLAVLDWRTMQQRVTIAMDTYRRSPPPVSVEELTESIAFLQWLLANHFTFLGAREYRFSGGAAKGNLLGVEDTGLGILRDPAIEVLRRGSELVSVTPEILDFLRLPVLLIITKSDVMARVHRRIAMDYIGLKLFDAEGNLSGELRVVGLFTSSAYTQNPYEIPLLRKKLTQIVSASGFSAESHSGKALNNVLENFPRDELFQIDTETLNETASGILRLEERPRTRLFVRHDRFDRFVSALLYLPRDRFNTELRLRAGDILAKAYGGRITSFSPAFGETPLVRVHFIITRNEGKAPRPDVHSVESEIAEAARNWDDHLLDAMAARGLNASIRRWKGAFPPAYTSRFNQTEALQDLLEIDRLATAQDVAIEFMAAEDDNPARCNAKLYCKGNAIPLSARLPILENMGFKSISESTYELNPLDGEAQSSAVVHDVLLETSTGKPPRIAELGDLLEEVFIAIWTGKAENDSLNALVLNEALPWREVVILRALTRYLRQTASTYSADYMAQTLVKHASVARSLVACFKAALDPANASGRNEAAARTAIAAALEQIPSLDEDRIIRNYLNLVSAITRTNYFHREQRPTLSFKIASKKVETLPEPKPFAEIFVYAPDVEGIHLRAGPVARGGLRWSDRPEDFRTEVLGLAKAQNVKNAVIVPVGAKGGFVPKKLPAGGSRDQIQAEGIRTYKLFVSSLLDITDNIVNGAIAPPPATARRDGDDPYLVVAADKGTAAFSDIANGISEEHDFWLGDAFASGGSAGYDHKKMAITARGGWEAVKRHFREMNVDISKTPFDVIGVGDMSGDVFGNGMLLSPAIKLVAAFDHRDIFIDPSPDPALSLAERRRLFELPRSSWFDYDKALISKGGGVFSRQLKSIPLSPEMQKLTGLAQASATPQVLMKALLEAETDLIWFGGIGTYVKASAEANADTGDRANDAIRVDAANLRTKVIGEGANLGLTQRARIEFAQKGGRINTDAVDNSAGVNSSDVEVNIKIALGAAERSGKLTRQNRNSLLVEMTDEVASLVLRNNYLQTLCLSLALARGTEGNGYAMELMNGLEARGLLDRKLEALPTTAAIVERDARGQSLTRPEYAVLMAYAKLTLNHELVNSSVPDDPYLARELLRYFPSKMREPFADEIAHHRLRRDIIATMLANSMINRGGPSFVSRLSEETGATPAAIAAAFAVARDSFAFTQWNETVDHLDNRIPAELQLQLYLELQKRLTWATLWYIRHENVSSGLESLVTHYRDGLASLGAMLPGVLGTDALAALAARQANLEGAGVPAETAARFASASFLQRGPDIVRIGSETGRSMKAAATALYASASTLMIDRIVEESGRIIARDFVERRAINRLVGQLYQTHRDIIANVLAEASNEQNAWESWCGERQDRVAKSTAALEELLAGRSFDLARLAVAQGTLADLAPR
jgi:glutamate dehydrogenase